MPKTLTVGTEDFEIPLEGDNAGYGEEVTDWMEAVSDALTTVQKPNDILDTTALILNNQSSATNVTGFAFDTTEVRSINCEFLITRTTDTNNLVESGFIEGNYDGSDWSITIRSTGNAGVDFTITSGGQVQYTSTNVSGANYDGSVLFRGKVFNEE